MSPNESAGGQVARPPALRSGDAALYSSYRMLASGRVIQASYISW